MQKVLSDKRAICLFILPTVLFFLLIVIIPIFMTGYYCLLDWSGFGKGEFVGLDNFVKMFFSRSSKFPKAAVNSLMYAAASVFIQLPISLLLALTLSTGVKAEGFYRSVYFIPVIISSVVIGQLWMKIYNNDYGLLNIFLRSVGLEQYTHIWLGEKGTALGATFVPMLWQYVGYHMLLLYGAIKSIPTEIVESARIDGASWARMAWSIKIPLIKPMMRVCTTFALIGSFKIFDLVFILTGGGPASASEMPATLMYKTIFLKNQYGYGSAMAVFIIVECLAFTMLLNALFRDADAQ